MSDRLRDSPRERVVYQPSVSHPFSAVSRQENLYRLAREEFDLLVIGGGITGTAVARDAAMRGIRTTLVEKNYIGTGASGRSSRLIHGGIRSKVIVNPSSHTWGCIRRDKLLRQLPIAVTNPQTGAGSSSGPDAPTSAEVSE